MRWPLLRHAKHTTKATLESLTDNQRLIGVLTGQYGDYGLAPSRSSFFIHALIASHYMEGAAYPVGGASRIAATILPVIEGADGCVVTNAEVQEIVIENECAVGITLTDGNEIRAPLIVSDAGVATTYGRLVPRETCLRLNLDALVDRHEPSAAHLSLYLGFNEGTASLGLGKSNLWIYPHHDHDRNVERFFNDSRAPLPVAYVSFPSAKDPSFEERCPGRATVEVITLVPYAWFRKWENKPWKKRGEEYEELKAKLAERMLEPLLAQCPQLRGKVDHMEISTPLSTRHFTGHAHGQIYGLAATPDFFADRALRPRTPIPGLFLTGSDVCTLGVGGALSGGMLTAAAILGRDLRGAIAKSANQARSRRASFSESSAKTQRRQDTEKA
jgi:all-trans-retinol 13,14-reductase